MHAHIHTHTHTYAQYIDANSRDAKGGAQHFHDQNYHSQ